MVDPTTIIADWTVLRNFFETHSHRISYSRLFDRRDRIVTDLKPSICEIYCAAGAQGGRSVGAVGETCSDRFDGGAHAIANARQVAQHGSDPTGPLCRHRAVLGHS